MTIDKIEVGNRIKSIRLNKGKTLEQFGEFFSTSKATVFNWEKGRNLPNRENLKIIAELGEITVDELLYGRLEVRIINLLNAFLKKNNANISLEKYSKIKDDTLEAFNNYTDHISDELILDTIGINFNRITGLMYIVDDPNNESDIPNFSEVELNFFQNLEISKIEFSSLPDNENDKIDRYIKLIESTKDKALIIYKEKQ